MSHHPELALTESGVRRRTIRAWRNFWRNAQRWLWVYMAPKKRHPQTGEEVWDKSSTTFRGAASLVAAILLYLGINPASTQEKANFERFEQRLEQIQRQLNDIEGRVVYVKSFVDGFKNYGPTNGNARREREPK